MNALQIAHVAQQAGFSGQGLVNAVAVALAESGGDPDAVGQNPGSVDRGLWQINSYYHAEVSDAQAFDPSQAAIAAYRISNAGSDWSQWSTWQNGAARAQMGAAQTAVAQLAGGTIPTPAAYSPTNTGLPRWVGPLLLLAGLAWALS